MVVKQSTHVSDCFESRTVPNSETSRPEVSQTIDF
jgi:hypothetical protein